MTIMANVGDVLAGKYRVDRVLGVGGMGMVVAATHLELDQKVALKFMLPAALASEEATDRFLREARAAVRLRGEHVCRVLDVGRLDGGAPYIVMEYLAGHDFATTLKQYGPLETADAIDYMLQAIEGVAEAHANNIVHRDLKPANLFVTTDNDGSPLVKVLDFGISKSDLAGVHQTRTGDIMGSPAYMAPEQMASSKDVDARADQWALGVILYQALSGRVPFAGDTLPVLCVQVMTEAPPPLAQVRPDLPVDLCAAVMRCLDKKRDARFADVGALAGALARFGSEGATAAAKRIAKVLARPVAFPPTPAAEAASSGTAPTLMTSTDVRAPPAPRRATLSTSAEGSSIASAAGEIGTAGPARSKIGLYGAVALVAIAAIAIGVLVASSRDGQTSDPVQPAARVAPPLAATLPAPTPVPVPTATPADAAVADVPPVAGPPRTDRKPPPARARPDIAGATRPVLPTASVKAPEPKGSAAMALPKGACEAKRDCAADQDCVGGACKKVDLTKQLISE